MIFVFDDCELDLDRYELRRGGTIEPVEPQVFDVLAVLIRERRRVVPKDELLDTVWGNRFVSESALTSRVKAARRAIGDDGRAQRLIRTVHGRGYQFVGEVAERSIDERPVTAARTWTPAPALVSEVQGRLDRSPRNRSGSARRMMAQTWRTRRSGRAHRW